MRMRSTLSGRAANYENSMISHLKTLCERVDTLCENVGYQLNHDWIVFHAEYIENYSGLANNALNKAGSGSD